MRRWIGAITRVLLLTAAGFLTGHGWAAEGPPSPRPSIISRPRGILFLNTYQIGHPIPDSIDNGFLAGLQAGGESVSNVFIKHLDLARAPDGQYEKDLGRLLYQEMTAKPIGLVIAEGTPAVNFFRTQCGNLFPDTPLLTLIVPHIAPAKNDSRKILDIPWHVDNAGTLNVALKLFPKTSNVFVVTGAKDTDLPFLEYARSAFASFKGLTFEYSNTMTYEQVLQCVSTLPPDSIVMYSPFFTDATGRSFVPADVVANICKASNAPVFANLAPYLGRGIVGGSLLETTSFGSRAAGLALDYLNGRLKIDKPVTTFAPSSKMMFDWRQLTRWDVRMSALPSGSMVINRPETLWGQHKQAIGIAVGLFVILGGALLILLLLNHRLKRLAIAFGKSEAHYHSIFATSLLGVTVADKDSVFTDVNDAFCRMLGYFSGELVGKKTISDVSYPEDVERITVMLNRLIAREIDQYTIETRFVTKSGTVLPAVIFVRGHYGPDGQYGGTTTSYLDITERKRVEAVLREREEKYRSLFNNAQIGMFRTNLDGSRMLDVNEKFLEIFGFARGEMLGTASVLYWADPEERAEMVRRLQTEGRVADYECKMLNKQGEVRHCRTSLRLYSEQGLLEGSIEDITERKQAAEALRDSEEKFRSFSEQSLVGIYLLKDGVFTYVNPKFAEIFGYSVQDCLGNMPFSRLVLPEDLDWVSEQVRQRTAGEVNALCYEFRGVRKDGQIINLDIFGSSIRLHGNLLAVGTILDITERKRAEEALRQSETQLRTLVDSAPLAILIQTGGCIAYINRQGVKAFGARAENELSGRPVLDMVPPQYQEHVKARTQKINIGKEPQPVSEYQFLTLAGDPFDVEVMSVPFRHLGEEGALVFFRDITQRKKDEANRIGLEAQLRQAQKMEAVGRLAGGVAHDFNNMLSVILGFTELALEETDPTHNLRDILQEIMNAAKRSADITRQLLAFARKQTISPKIIDINKVVGGMSKMLQRLIGEDIELAYLPGNDVWPLMIDPGQIDQILANLCVNARDAISDVGKVSIETGNAEFNEAYCADHLGFAPGEYVMLMVSDTGCGMDAETLNHIFDPFFTTKEFGSGTGLGAATVFGIVKQNNGFINVYSEPGHGTTFKIYLPRYRTKSDFSVEKAKRPSIQRGNETILLAEDEPAILGMTTKMLERLGYTVAGVGTPGEAIGLARKYKGEIDLFITDVIMPEMNGSDLAKQIRAFHPNIKTLFMSGYTANVIAHHGVLDKGVNFIQKPFSKAQLGMKVREALGGSKT